MKSTKVLAILVLALGLMAWLPKVGRAEPVGTAWTYQGRLLDANGPADGLYDFQFKLYDSDDPCTGEQMGGTININDLDVIDGYFTVELDFGGDVFNGDARWLETTVANADGSDPHTLSPRRALTPAPYAIYAQTAGADNDWMVSGNNMGAIPSGNVGIGTWNPSEKLDVRGDISTSSVYKIGGSTVLSSLGLWNIFVGRRAGANNTTGDSNTFIGEDAGRSNTTGMVNTFVGERAGYSNTTGMANTFVGRDTGYSNTTGFWNTFLGVNAGISNTTGYNNTFVGLQAGGSNTTGQLNTFLGSDAGYLNTTGNENTFVGTEAGYKNTTGAGNVFIGYKAGYSKNVSNKLYIANSDTNSPLIYGDFSTDRLGIGTTSPTAKLHIGGTAGVDGIRFPDGTLQTTAAGNSLDQAYDQGGAGWGRTITADAGAVNIAGPDGLTVNGNVGIGTTSPAYKLQIEGGSSPLLITAGGIDWPKFKFDVKTDGYSVLRIYDGYNEDFRFDTDGDSWLRGNGNVGIGTTTPSSKLHVAGGCITGSMCSDIRLKKNIEPLPADDSILDRVMGLQAVTFEWKHREDGKRQIGLIAQDVEKVFPEVVTTPDDGTCQKGLLATGMDAVLVEGIKELKVENELLKDRIEALERTIHQLTQGKMIGP